MFTLAELVGRASSAPPPPPDPASPGARREGSGVIDLNAMARAAEERARKAPSEPPPAAFAREARSFPDETPPVPGRRLRFAGIAVGAMVLALVGVIVATSGAEDPKPRALRTVAAPAQKVIDRGPSTRVSDVDSAQAPKVGTSGFAKASGRRGGHARVSAGPKLTKVTSSGTGDVGAKAPPPPKPKAASDPCGCHGNLQCAIKCFK